MKIVFYASDKPREHMLAKALAEGAQRHGDTLEIRRTGQYGEDENENDLKYPGPSPDTDVACVFGVKGRSRRILDDHRAMGISTLFFDKGYSRRKGEGGHTEYSRISVNDWHPLKYMMRQPRGSDRWEKLGWRLPERTKSQSGHVLLCLSSQKYNDFHKLGPCDDQAKAIIASIRKHTGRQIVYRPKPSSKARPLPGVLYSGGNSTMFDALRGAHCVVTHGATSALDAIVNGVPAVTLGACIASPVCEDDIEKIEDPKWFKQRDRETWAHAMAWCQWTTAELRSGVAWKHLKAEIELQRK